LSEDLEHKFLNLIEENSGIIHKVTRLYAADMNDEKDLRQEVIYQAWRSFSRFDGRSKFSTWLYKVALNTALTHRRKQKKSLNSNLEERLQAEGGDARGLLIRLIKDLSAIDKLVIMLHLDGYANDEVAEISGLKKNHVAVKIYRIKDLLKDKLKNNS
jgi:RNA polymerase sigma factor (sigma-70 family)